MDRKGSEPGMPALHYELSNLKNDFFAGLTAAIVSLPLALAFGVASGFGPAAGIYGAIITGILAAMFGGTPLQVTGPTAPMTVFVATLAAAHDAKFVFGVIILAGIFQIIFGLIKLGEQIEFLPYPVISGFMTGVALLIIKSQLDTVFAKGLLTIGIVAVTIAITHLSPRMLRGIPGALVALIIVSLASIFLGLGLPTIGELPKALPQLNLSIIPGIGSLFFMILPAISLALLGSIDTLLTSVIADTVTGKEHDSNRELIGQGIGNLAAGFFGGIPGAGATVRTLVNIKVGAKTRLSGILCGIFLLLIMIFLGGFASYIPLSALAGILIYTAINIIDYDGLRSIPLAPKADTIVMLITIVTTVVADLIVAVGVGLSLSAFLFLKMLSELEVVELTVMEHASDDEKKNLGKYQRKIAIYQINGPLFFGAATKFTRSIKVSGTFKVVILKMFAVTAIDQTGLRAFSAMLRHLKANGVTVIVTNLQPKTEAGLKKAGLLDEIGSENIFKNPKLAIEGAKEIVDSS
jgi:sulfate permease, SulP family